MEPHRRGAPSDADLRSRRAGRGGDPAAAGLHCALLALLLLAACAPTLRTEAGAVCATQLPGPDRPYRTVAEVRDHLHGLERFFRERNDRRAVFASLYAHATTAIDRAVRQNRFDDGPWVATVTVLFADLYRQALFDFECGRLERVPGAWRLAFEAARADGGALQAAVLGVNAHINHDLAIALERASVAAGRSSDNALITEVLVGEIEGATERLAALYDADLARLDRQLGGFDEIAMAQILRSWRSEAWDRSFELARASERWGVLWTLEVASSVRGWLLAELLGRAPRRERNRCSGVCY